MRKKRKIISSLLGLIILFSLFISCEDNPVTPNEPPPGRRDYVWSADTLVFPIGEQTSISSIWGASPGDVWACGRGTSNKYRLWHYNGEVWSGVDAGFSIIEARKVFGFDKSNIWLGTAFGLLAYYNGSSWSQVGNFSTEDEEFVIQGIWGRNINDLYVFGFLDKKDRTGYRGAILKYNGDEWSFLNIDTLRLGFNNMGYDEPSNKYFVSSYSQADGMQTIFELRNEKLIKLSESKEGSNIIEMAGKVYFKVGKKILKYDKQFGLFIWKDFSNINLYSGPLAGRNENDIFTANFVGMGHYNGNNIEILYETEFWFTGIMLFEKDIIVGLTNYQTAMDIMLHGKLK